MLRFLCPEELILKTTCHLHAKLQGGFFYEINSVYILDFENAKVRDDDYVTIYYPEFMSARSHFRLNAAQGRGTSLRHGWENKQRIALPDAFKDPTRKL